MKKRGIEERDELLAATTVYHRGCKGEMDGEDD
jgi:hypothetical protein